MIQKSILSQHVFKTEKRVRSRPFYATHTLAIQVLDLVFMYHATMWISYQAYYYVVETNKSTQACFIFYVAAVDGFSFFPYMFSKAVSCFKLYKCLLEPSAKYDLVSVVFPNPRHE